MVLARKTATPGGIRRYLARAKDDCRRHLAKHGSEPPPNHNLRGYDMEVACLSCFHCNMRLAPYCHVARVEQGVQPRTVGPF